MVPGFAALAGLALGYVAHLLLDRKVENAMAEATLGTPYAKAEPTVTKKNVFTSKVDDTKRESASPQLHWISNVLGPVKTSRFGGVMNPNLETLKNLAAEILQDVPSALKLEGADVRDPKNLREVRTAKAYGVRNWRSFEEKLVKESEFLESKVTQAVFSNLKSLDRPGGRSAIFKRLGFKRQYSRKLVNRDFVLSQLGEGGADQPAVVNAKLAEGDMTFFFARGDQAQGILESAKESDPMSSFDAMLDQAVVGLHSGPVSGDKTIFGSKAGGKNLTMAQSSRHDGSFRIHVAAVLDKTLGDLFELKK